MKPTSHESVGRHRSDLSPTERIRGRVGSLAARIARRSEEPALSKEKLADVLRWKYLNHSHDDFETEIEEGLRDRIHRAEGEGSPDDIAIYVHEKLNGIVDVDSLREYISDHIPPLAYTHVDTIIFRPFDIGAKEAVYPPDMFVGEYVYDDATDSSHINVRVPFHKYEWWRKLKKETVEASVRDTLAHEMGHALVSRLPIALLARWDEVMKRGLPRTKYRGSSATKRHENYYDEQFADGFMLHANHARHFRSLSGEHFAAMKEIVGYLMPSEQPADEAA